MSLKFCHYVTRVVAVIILIVSSDVGLFSTGSNVLSYVNMVCASLRNSIPKSVVYCQVREAKRSLLDHFFTDLGKKEVRILHLTVQLPELYFYFIFIWQVFWVGMKRDVTGWGWDSCGRREVTMLMTLIYNILCSTFHLVLFVGETAGYFVG